MHACGHDVHYFSLLGVADFKQSVKNKFGEWRELDISAEKRNSAVPVL